MQKRSTQLHRRIIFLFLLIQTASFFAEQSYIITEEVFRITGRTKEKSLIQIIDTAKGKTFATKEELITFVNERTQKLENLRSFKETRIDTEYLESEETEVIPVILTVSIVDGTPILPIPYAFYNSNDGVQAGTLLNLPNVAGTLQNAMFVGLYMAPPDNKDNIQWTNPNFMLLGNWSGFRIKPLELGISALAMKMSQRIESRGEAKIYMSTFYFSGSIHATYALSETISNTVSVRATGSPDNKVTKIVDADYLAYGPITSSWEIQNTISYSNFNWIGNFRDGYKGKLAVGYTSYFPRFSDARTDLLAEAEFSGYYPIGRRLNPSFRIYTFANSGIPQLQSAFYIRGIRNAELPGNEGVFLNTGMQIKLARLGAAELHLTPGVDYGLVHSDWKGKERTESGFGVGSELILIFDSMKTIPFKLGFAYDLRPKYKDKPAKRIEIDFNFNLAY